MSSSRNGASSRPAALDGARPRPREHPYLGVWVRHCVLASHRPSHPVDEPSFRKKLYEGVTRYASKTASSPRSAFISDRSDFTSPTSAVYQFFASWSSTTPP